MVGSLVVNFGLILLAFNLTTADAVKWRDIYFGAALATVFWQSLQLIGSWYIGRELQHATNTYGFFAIVIVLLSWIYLGAQLFLLAAEINVVKRFRLWPRSMTQPPRSRPTPWSLNVWRKWRFAGPKSSSNSSSSPRPISIRSLRQPFRNRPIPITESCGPGVLGHPQVKLRLRRRGCPRPSRI